MITRCHHPKIILTNPAPSQNSSYMGPESPSTWVSRHGMLKCCWQRNNMDYIWNNIWIFCRYYDILTCWCWDIINGMTIVWWIPWCKHNLLDYKWLYGVCHKLTIPQSSPSFCGMFTLPSRGLFIIALSSMIWDNIDLDDNGRMVDEDDDHPLTSPNGAFWSPEGHAPSPCDCQVTPKMVEWLGWFAGTTI